MSAIRAPPAKSHTLPAVWLFSLFAIRVSCFSLSQTAAEVFGTILVIIGAASALKCRK